jgi:hypothetical protein
MNTKEIKEEIIKELIKPIFKENGFKTSGTTFLKQEEGFVKVFNIQSSKWNHKECVSFTFNIGIFLPMSYELIRPLPLPKNIKESDCQFKMRISDLLKKEDDWYEVKTGVDIDNLKIEKIEIYQDIKKTLEFYNNRNTVEALAELPDLYPFCGLNEIAIVDIALTLYSLDKNPLGEQLLKKYYEKQTKDYQWAEIVKEAAKIVGIELI